VTPLRVLVAEDQLLVREAAGFENGTTTASSTA
jgi:hypothetical protein